MQNNQKTKTFPQCCDEALKGTGWVSLKHFLSRRANNQNGDTSIVDICKEAAELYREEGIREALKLRKEWKVTRNPLGGVDYKYTDQEIIDKLKA